MQRERASRKDLQEQEGNFRAQETRRSSVHPTRQSQGGGTARRQKWRQGSYRRQHCFSSSICATCASTTIIHNDHHACKRHFGHCSEGLRRIRCLTVTPVHEAGGVMRIKSQIPLHGKGGVWQKQPPPPPTIHWRSSSQDNWSPTCDKAPTNGILPPSQASAYVHGQNTRPLKPRSARNLAVVSPGQRVNNHKQSHRHL